MIRCVLFDMDGTIINSECYTISSKIEEGKKLGYDIKESDVIASFGMSRINAMEHFKKLYGENFPYMTLSKARYDYIYKAMKDGTFTLMPYAKEIISFLKKEKIKVVLCTSTPKEHLHSYQKLVPLLNEFDAYVTNDEVQHGKPSPDIFLLGMERVGVTKEESIVVEDALSGVKAGIASKAYKTIMVPDYVQPDEFVRQNDVLVVKSLKGVEDFVKKVNNIK